MVRCRISVIYRKSVTQIQDPLSPELSRSMTVSNTLLYKWTCLVKQTE